MIRLWAICFLCSLGASLLLAQHSLQRFNYPINTDHYDDISPVISTEQHFMFFTRVGSPDFDRTLYFDSVDLYKTLDSIAYASKLADIYRMLSGRKREPYYSSTYNQDIWFALHNGGVLESVSHPGYPINSALPNSICSPFGSKGDYLIVNQFFADGSLQPGFSATTFDGKGHFSFPKPITITQFSHKGGEVNVTADQKADYLVLAFEKHHGSMDLYVSHKIDDTLYSMPVPLEQLNTFHRESTPFLTADGERLYFASDRIGSMGGTDIYYTDRLTDDWLQWTEPVRLAPPINSSFDESHPYLTSDHSTMLFTSNRDGSMDIFRAKVFRDDGLESNITINVRVYDGEGQMVPSEIHYEGYRSDLPDVSGYFRTRDGFYAFDLEENIPIAIHATSRKEKSQLVTIDPQELSEAGLTSFDVDLYLGMDGTTIHASMSREVDVFGNGIIVPLDGLEDPLATKDKDRNTSDQDLLTDEERSLFDLENLDVIPLNNIYFSKGRADVLPASYATLSKLAKVVKAHPKVIIQIEGHTDNVGDKRALQQVSEDRCKAIEAFLIKEGVAPEAIKTKGYGDSAPITGNETERDRKRNRRVEIRVLRQQITEKTREVSKTRE